MQRLCQMLCCCCYRRNKNKNYPDYNEDGSKLLEKGNENKATNFLEKDNQPVTPDIAIPPFNEQFTREFAYHFIEREINDTTNYEQFYSKDNMILYMNKSGSVFSSKFPTIKMTYMLKKSEFPENITIKDISYYMNTPAIRRKWDKTMKDYKILEGNDELYILHTVLNKPVFFISERDVVMKRFDFYQNNCFYFFTRSTIDEKLAELPDIIRMDNLFSGYRISEKDDMFHFSSLAQMDFKMNLPQSVFKVTMPMTLFGWYKNLKNIIVNEHKKVD